MRYVVMLLVYYFFHASITNLLCELSLNLFNFYLTLPIAELLTILLIIVVVYKLADNISKSHNY